MSNFNYLYTNVFGAIKTTGSGCFSGARDDRGKYATITMNSLDIKYKLNQEIVYKYINSDSPLYLGKEFKINEKVFFGAYAGLKLTSLLLQTKRYAIFALLLRPLLFFNPA